MVVDEAARERDLRRKHNIASRDAEVLTEEMKDDVLALLVLALSAQLLLVVAPILDLFAL